MKLALRSLSFALFALYILPLFSQTEFNTSFKNAFVEGNKFCTDLEVSFDAIGSLGTSNFVFDYDGTKLDNPVISVNYLSAPPAYFAPTLTEPIANRVSVNVELGFPGLGDEVAVFPASTSVARVCFDRLVQLGTTDFTWFNAGTIVFLDDESTILAPNNLEGITNVNLPVELLSFKGKVEEMDAVLEWITATEVNNSHFDIERSIDGNLFNRIGSVEGSGNVQQSTNYKFVDENIIRLREDRLYYRLRQLDIDGTATYSSVVEVSIDMQQGLHISGYPSPFTDALSIDYLNPSNTPFEVSVVSPLGVEMWSTIERELSGTERIDSKSWPSGMYFLQMKNERQKVVYKILKL